MPVADCANQGAATISTKVSATSVRQTNDDQSGCSPTRMRPTTVHFAAVLTAAATTPAPSITIPLSSTVVITPNVAMSAARANRTPRPIPHDTMTGTRRSSSHSARATRRRNDGLNVRLSSAAATVLRRRTAGDPSHDDPAFDLRGAAESTATSPSFGTLCPPAAIPELPMNARLPISAAPTRTQPPPSS